MPDVIDIGFIPTASALVGLLAGVLTFVVVAKKEGLGNVPQRGDKISAYTAIGALFGGVLGGVFFLVGVVKVIVE